MNEKKQRMIFGSLLVLSFLAILIYNFLTPLMSDDLLFDESLYHSIGDIFRQEYHQYLTWNGRSVLQIILKVFSILPKWVFNICNSLCFVYTSLLIYWNISGREKYDCFLFLLIQLLMWNFSVDFDQTVLWLGGACNYLWGVMIILSFITLYRHLLGKQAGGERLTSVNIFFLMMNAFLAGWGNENTSGGAILIVGLFTLSYVWKNRRIEKWMAAGLLSSLIGFAFLLLAPGNAARGSLMKAEETYSGAAALVSRGLKIFKAIDSHLLVFMVVICLLGTYFYYEKKKLVEFREVAIFVFASLATAAVLIFTPEPMPRAYYGAGIYMMIAALNMVWKIKPTDGLLYRLRTGGILAGLLVFTFIYIEEGANLTRILREVNEREAYIAEEVAKGNRDLTLPMLRPAFETPYSYLYENDLSKEEEFWINEVFCIAYDLDSITVLERDEWNEFIEIQE
ncbi:MAG: hypothetical protein IJP31_12520 [Lachnospiraceae bacterium]|nr:hypothetical protein [Lachnospiraceae bacterium]